MKDYIRILATLLSLLIPVQSWGADFQKGLLELSNLFVQFNTPVYSQTQFFCLIHI